MNGCCGGAWCCGWFGKGEVFSVWLLGNPPPLVLTRACPNTVTPCFRTFALFFGTIVLADPIQWGGCLNRARTVHLFGFCLFPKSTMPESELPWPVPGLRAYCHRSTGERVPATIVTRVRIRVGGRVGLGGKSWKRSGIMELLWHPMNVKV